MNNRKCPACKLVNFAGDEVCRRCGAPLDAVSAARAPSRKSLLGRIIAGFVIAFLILVALHSSLLFTSEPVTAEERQTTMRAVRVLEERGFTREAWMLRHVASFRRTDHWWNRYVGHADAYAATNFPLGIVTLYPDFFTVPADDTERAAVLLHEAQHLRGADERQAFAEVWMERARLGWTADKYAGTRIWRGTQQLTREHAPELFAAGTSVAAKSNAD